MLRAQQNVLLSIKLEEIYTKIQPTQHEIWTFIHVESEFLDHSGVCSMLNIYLIFKYENPRVVLGVIPA